MEFKQYEYKIVSHIQIDLDDVERLEVCANRHYDGVCKDMVKPGGLIYGWRNHLTTVNRKITVTVNWSQVDTICKILENALYHPQIHNGVLYATAWCTLLKQMSAEYKRVNNVTEG